MKAMFCSPLPCGRCSRSPRFFRLRLRMSPVQKQTHGLTFYFTFLTLSRSFRFLPNMILTYLNKLKIIESVYLKLRLQPSDIHQSHYGEYVSPHFHSNSVLYAERKTQLFKQNQRDRTGSKAALRLLVKRMCTVCQLIKQHICSVLMCLGT